MGQDRCVRLRRSGIDRTGELPLAGGDHAGDTALLASGVVDVDRAFGRGLVDQLLKIAGPRCGLVVLGGGFKSLEQGLDRRAVADVRLPLLLAAKDPLLLLLDVGQTDVLPGCSERPRILHIMWVVRHAVSEMTLRNECTPGIDVAAHSGALAG